VLSGSRRPGKPGWLIFGQRPRRTCPLDSAGTICRERLCGLVAGREIEMLGIGSDVLLAILLLIVWFVLMRIVLPRLGVST